MISFRDHNGIHNICMWATQYATRCDKENKCDNESQGSVRQGNKWN